MNNWYFIGTFIFYQFYISFGREIQSTPGEIQFLCTIFPEILKEKCAEYNENEFENNIKIKVHSEIEISSTSKSMVCKICKERIQDVYDTIGKNPSRDVIRKALERECDRLPPYMKYQCKFLLDRLEDNLVNMIINYLPVDQICNIIGLCGSIGIQHSQTSKSIQCEICKRVIQEVLNEIGSDHSKDAIRNALEQVCDNVPPFLKSGCKDFIDKFTNELIDMIMKNLPVDQICRNFGLCSSNNIDQSKKMKSIQCMICKRIIEEIFRRIGKKRTADAIKRALQSICYIFPSNIRYECRNFMKRFSGEIIKLIMNNTAPNLICNIFQLCSTNFNSKDSYIFFES